VIAEPPAPAPRSAPKAPRAAARPAAAAPIALQDLGRPRRRAVAPVYGVVVTRPRLDLGRPIALLGLAVVLMAADFAYAVTVGHPLQVGPARTIWVAGPIALAGAVSLIRRLIEYGD
jgi:hypothetical protein